MTTERKTEREFGIYNVAKDKFYNLDYLNGFGSEEEFVEEPNRKFTYEECERYIVHKNEKEYLTIINLLQPKYLLAFQLDYLRKEFSEKYNKKLIESNNKSNAESLNSTRENSVFIQNKQNYMSDLHNWSLLLNSKETQLKGKYGIVLGQKPDYRNYNLSYESFTQEEKISLKRNFGIVH